MKLKDIAIQSLFVAAACLGLNACINEEDPGPIQEIEQEYAILDFDRLEMGDAFVITVQQSPLYSVRVKGDRRNLDDLTVEKVGTTLRARYNHYENRQYTTYITITMPEVKGINFSGATTSTITGFNDLSVLDCTLSGASVAQWNLIAESVQLNLSGASKLTATGSTANLHAIISGASVYSGFSFTADAADLDVSGASKANVTATTTLVAKASGASTILYRGDAAVTPTISGASSIQKD